MNIIIFGVLLFKFNGETKQGTVKLSDQKKWSLYRGGLLKGAKIHVATAVGT